MTDSDEDKGIAERLRHPPSRSNSRATATGLVRRHYDEIHAAWMKDRQAGKTWEEIGRDLRPDNPIAAGTVGRAFARVSAERARLGIGKSKSAIQASFEKSEPSEPDARAQVNEASNRRNPFSRSVDPIRADNLQEDQNA